MTEKKSGKDARGGPMRILYTIIIVGIIAIVGISVLFNRGPQDTETPEATQPAN
ncbi:hypothetical protein [Falsirhodobacter deserti]|uniref:hypothetical protein n=1 Tax=Falsirhodobacter deserti TaxID=1365611 RepID=UPI0013E3B5EE|nr:hypothetical protein [Falsirhodobacter deserti]